MTALEEYEKHTAPHPTVEGALHVFLDTDLDLDYEGGEAWINYAAFCARVSNTPEGAALHLKARCQIIRMKTYFGAITLSPGR